MMYDLSQGVSNIELMSKSKVLSSPVVNPKVQIQIHRMKDEGWIFQAVGGFCFMTDRQSNKRTLVNIVAFVTENCYKSTERYKETFGLKTKKLMIFNLDFSNYTTSSDASVPKSSRLGIFITHIIQKRLVDKIPTTVKCR